MHVQLQLQPAIASDVVRSILQSPDRKVVPRPWSGIGGIGEMIPPPSTQEQANAACIRRIADHADRAAFAALFAHFAPRVKAYMRRLGAADAQSEDLAQEAMFAVWRKASLFDPARAGAATWVFTIARNLRIDTLRRERPTEALPPEAEAQEADSGPGAEAELMIAERDLALRTALSVLPPEQAQLVQLAFYEDRPHREIEIALRIPLGTVKSRLRMAMQRLRAALEDPAGIALEERS